MKRLTKSVLCGLLSAAMLSTTACALIDPPKPTTPGTDEVKIEYEEFITNTVGFNDNSDPTLSNYNSEIYYLNQWENFTQKESIGFPDMGDPCIVYYDGAYYAYGTRGTTTFHCFRSYDLSHWERLEDCFTPAENSWSRYNLWAPDIQCIDGKYYLYYTAAFDYSDSSNCQIGVAVADAPYGPFIQYTGTNANNERVMLRDTPFQGMEHHTILDQTVFQDDDGELYMYFSFDTTSCNRSTCPNYEQHQAQIKDNAVAEIWGVKMKDPVTWDISTMTPLACPGYKKLSDETPKIKWERWSPSFGLDFECAEGPYMVKNNGKYYLTYCANSYVDECYAVGYAVSDNPLGDFEKPNDSYLENMLLGVPDAPGTFLSNRYKGFTRGTGHAAIFKTGSGELMFAYHAHYNREAWDPSTSKGDWRALSIDYLHFNENGAPYTNGPTYSLQRVPSDISGYENIAGQAIIRAQGEDVQFLNDNFTNRAFKTAEIARETTFEAGTRSIEIKFDTPMTIRALNIFNSYDRALAIDLIKQIDFGNGKGVVNVNFNQRYYHEKYDDFIFPHCAFNIELDEEITTDRIVITIDSNHDFALGEIEVLGKFLGGQQ